MSSTPIAEKPRTNGTGGMKRKFDSSSSSQSSSTKHADKKYKRDDKAGSTKKPWQKDWKKGGDKKPLIMSRKDRQEKKKERKAAKPNADIIAEANKVWQTSFTTLSASERTANISSLLTHMSGKMQEVGLKHDASRAIQLAIKYATEEQKHIMIKELTGHFKHLSEETYGHYIIVKLLSNDTRKNDAKKQCLKEFKGHVNKLSMQPDSAKVLDYLYASSSKKDQNSLLQEFYSPEFIVFAEDEGTKEKTLTELIQAKPEKKNQILENLRKYIDKALEKNMIMFRFLHALILQYLSHATLSASENEEKDFLGNLYQHIPALYHSQDGCRIICHLLSVGTSAKERKNILKHFKGLVGNMAERPEGVWILNTICDVVDDIVLIEKTIFSELLPNLKDQFSHQYSSRIYLHVLNPQDSSVFSKEEQMNYSLSGRWILNPDQAKEVTKQGQGMLSKKDPAIKRLELLSIFLLPLLQELNTRPDVLQHVLRENFGHHLLVEAVKEAWRLTHDAEAIAASSSSAPAAAAGDAAGGKKGKKGKAAAAAVKTEDEDTKMEDADETSTPAATAGAPKFPPSLAKKLPQLTQQLEYIFSSIVQECSAAVGTKGGEKGEKGNAMEDRFGHYAIKRLIALEPTPTAFLEKLLDAIEPELKTLACTNRPAFVLASILENKVPVFADRLKKSLKPFLKEIKAAAEGTPAVAPETKEDAPSSSKTPYARKNAIVYNAHSTTSAGSDLLAKLIQGLPTGKSAASSSSSSSAPAATPAKPTKPAAASKSTAKKSGKQTDVKVEEDVEMEDAQPASAPTKTPAKGTTKKATTTAKKSNKKKSADDMEE